MKTKTLLLMIPLVIFSINLSFANLTQTVRFPKSDLILSKKQAFDRVSLPNSFSTPGVGAPELPVRTFSFIIPQAVEVTGVKVLSFERETIEGKYHIYPRQRDLAIGEEERFTEPDKKIYSSEKLYPGNIVELTGEGYMGGNHLVSIVVYPVQYLPADKELIFYSSITFEIQYRACKREYIKPSRMDSRYETLYEEILKKTTMNPHDLPACKPSVFYESFAEDEELLVTEAPSPLGVPVPYVIITNDAIAPAFQPLADWKTRKGTITIVKTISWIQDHYLYGSDLQENIRNFIKDAYINWGTVWILLGGDLSILPARHILFKCASETNILTDMYYSCLDGNYNTDRDPYYGEPEDSVDLYPDVYVGRVPVLDSSEAATFVNKVLSYEKISPYTDYQTTALLLSSKMFDPGDGQVYTDTLANHLPPDFVKTKMYEYLAQDGIDSINAGYAIIINYSHSSSYSNFITRYSPREAISNGDVDELSNNNRFSVMLNVTCSNNRLDLDCISKHFIKNNSGGGVCYIGSVLGDYPGISQDLHIELFDQLFSENEVNVGKAFALSKLPWIPLPQGHYTKRYITFSYLLLGDPQMEIWTQTPSEFSVTYPESLSQGINWGVSVTVEENSTPVESALVCFKKDNDIYRQVLTNSQGTAFFGLIFIQNPGEASFVVSKPGFLPADTVIPVVENWPALRTDGIIIDDDSLGSSLGNSDGEIDAGEEIELQITVKNCSNSTAYNVHVSLTSDDTLVMPEYGYIDYGDIPPESSYTPSEKFVVHVSPACPDQHIVTGFKINMSTRSEYYRFTVNAPVLAQDAHEIDDDSVGESAGNGNGLVEYGETVELPLSIHNDGRASIDGVWARLSINDSLITIVRDSVYYGRIDFDQWIFGETSFVFTSNHSNDDTIEFTLEIFDGYGRTTGEDFKVLSASSPKDLSYAPYSTSIDVIWAAPDSQTALAGYHLYRGLTENNLSRVNASLIRNASYYHDHDLSNNTTYYYKVTTVDSSGNESPRSDLLAAATNPPRKDGWPPQTIFEKHDGSAALVDLDNDGYNDLLIPSYKGFVYAWKADGSELIDGDNDPSTDGIFAIAPDTTKADFRWATPALGDLDQDGYQDVVVASYGGDHKIYAWRIDGDSTAYVEGWPRSFGGQGDNVTVGASPCLADLDADGKLEVIAIVNNYNSQPYQGVVHVWRNDGTGFLSGDSTFASFDGGWNFAAPAIGDLDQDGTYEIIVGTKEGKLYAWDTSASALSGFPVTLETEGDLKVSTPLIADIDTNFAGLEIVVVSGGNKVHVIHNDGTEMSNWPFVSIGFPPYYETLPLSMGDVDNDGEWEILCNLSRKVYALEGNADTVSGWPVSIPNSGVVGPFSTPLVGDIDGDDSIEVIVASWDNKIYAFEGNGAQFRGFPLSIVSGITTMPVIGKLNSGSTIDLIAGAKDSVYAWNLNGNYNRGNIHWGTFQHDLHRTGNWWGNEPEVSQIIMPNRVCKNSDTIVYVNVSDQDTLIGDSLSFDWSVTDGSITGSGWSVTYHAPASTGDVTITVVVSDKGGNAVKRTKTFEVVWCHRILSHGGGPFLCVWTGNEFEEDNTILAGCKLRNRAGKDTTDYYLLKKPLTSKDNQYHLQIRESEQEKSYLDNFELFLVDHAAETKVGVTHDGHIFGYESEISPLSCIDHNGKDQLVKVIHQDGFYYTCKGAGHLVLTFGSLQGLLPHVLFGSESPLPPEKKAISGSPDVPLNATLEVCDASGNWIKLLELPPRANPDLTFTFLDREYLDSEGRVKLRISWKDHYSADRIALFIVSEDSPMVYKSSLSSAIHSVRGEVSNFLSKVNRDYVTLIPDERIELIFPKKEENTRTREGFCRDFVLKSQGYYVKLGEESTEEGLIPKEFALFSNYPNPFNAETVIKYALPTESDVKLTIYNILGQKVKTLVDRHEPPGHKTVFWDSKNDKGHEVASGIYFYTIKAGEFTESKKMVILK